MDLTFHLAISWKLHVHVALGLPLMYISLSLSSFQWHLS